MDGLTVLSQIVERMADKAGIESGKGAEKHSFTLDIYATARFVPPGKAEVIFHLTGETMLVPLRRLEPLLMERLPHA